MFNVVVTDINGNAYNFDCDYFVEGFDNTNKKRDLTLYKNNDNMKNEFVDSYSILEDVEISLISIFDGEEEIVKYDKYHQLATASVTCRKGTEDRPNYEDMSLFQGVAIFRK